MGRHFTHLQTGEPVKDRRALYTVLLAEATNQGLAKMAQACPEYTYRQLAWIADWYVRDETCSPALASIINAKSSGCWVSFSNTAIFCGASSSRS